MGHGFSKHAVPTGLEGMGLLITPGYKHSAPTELKTGQCNTMKKYVCNECGYIYDPAEGDPDAGIAPGTAFEDLPEDWVCPVCGAPKEKFTVEE